MLGPQEILFIIGGACALLAVAISSNDIAQHFMIQKDPVIQKCLVRILIMIPVFAVDSFISLVWQEAAFFFILLRDIYESYVIFLFFDLLVYLMKGEEELSKELSKIPHLHPLPFPFGCIKVRGGGIFLTNIKRSILQFVILNGVLSITTFVLDIFGYYGEGEWKNIRKGYLWINILYNVTFTIALYGLVLFYESTQHLMAQFKPLAKFICLKAVIFFSFWQGLAITGLSAFDLLPEIGDWTGEEVGVRLNNFLICVEIMFCALGFSYAFSVHSYDDPAAWGFWRVIGNLINPLNCWRICVGAGLISHGMREVMDLSDQLKETKSTFAKKARDFVDLGDFYEISYSEKRERIILEGYAKKRSSNFSVWKSRYFFLLRKPPGIPYFSDYPYRNPNKFPVAYGFINFLEVTRIEVSAVKPNTIKFVIPTKKNYKIAFATQGLAKLWMDKALLLMDEISRTSVRLSVYADSEDEDQELNFEVVDPSSEEAHRTLDSPHSPTVYYTPESNQTPFVDSLAPPSALSSNVNSPQNLETMFQKSHNTTNISETNQNQNISHNPLSPFTEPAPTPSLSGPSSPLGLTVPVTNQPPLNFASLSPQEQQKYLESLAEKERIEKMFEF